MLSVVADWDSAVGLPCKDEGLPHIIILLAHDPVISAHAGNVLATIAFHTQDQVVVRLQVYDFLRLYRLLQHSRGSQTCSIAPRLYGFV